MGSHAFIFGDEQPGAAGLGAEARQPEREREPGETANAGHRHCAAYLGVTDHDVPPTTPVGSLSAARLGVPRW